jgi:hypothetical protein
MQKLIYQGKRLDDAETVRGLKLADGHVLQVIEERLAEPDPDESSDEATHLTALIPKS